MKKVIAMLLSAMLILSSCACAAENSEKEKPTETSPADGETVSENVPTGKKDGLKLCFIARATVISDFWVTMENAAVAACREGDEMVIFDSNVDLAKEIQYVEDAIAAGYDGIIYTTNDSETGNQIAQMIKEAGIPFVSVDSCPSDYSLAYTNILNDNETAGTLAGEALAEAMGYQGKAICYFEATIDSGKEKGLPAVAALEKHGIEVIVVDGTGLASEALEKISAALQANPDVTGIFAFNTGTASGALSALEAVGMDVPITVIDASRDDCNYITTGEYYAASTQSPTKMGEAATEMLYKAIDGEASPGEVYRVSSELITKDNVKEYGDPGF